MSNREAVLNAGIDSHAMLLRLARDQINTGGWTQEAYGQGGKYCAVGAMLQVMGCRTISGSDDALVQIMESAAGHLADLSPLSSDDRYGELPNINKTIRNNDECIRSKEEALAWFDAAIRNAEADQ